MPANRRVLPADGTDRPSFLPIRRRVAVAAAGAGLALLLGATRPAAAQTRLAVDGSAGWVGFPDDGYLVSELLAGTAVRISLTPRLAVGPELTFVSGDGHSHLILTGNLTFDLRRPAASPRATPFLVVGAGLFQTREQLFTGPYTSREGAFTAGGGVRASVGERGTIGVEARMGWEAHLRLNAVVGWRLGGAP
ncbi:MAG: hypothetical protein AB7I25_01175 [Vicinamibacterales bacterium]